MATALQNLELDAQDLARLLASSTREANKSFLASRLEQVQAQVADEQQKRKAQQEKQAVASSSESADATAETETGTATETETETNKSNGGNTEPAIPAVAPGATYVPIHTFGWDQSDKFVSVYVSESMEGVKAAGAEVKCNFTDESFDLTVEGFVAITLWISLDLLIS